MPVLFFFHKYKPDFTLSLSSLSYSHNHNYVGQMHQKTISLFPVTTKSYSIPFES